MLPRFWGPTGRLARENARRNPRRTAATAVRPDDRARPVSARRRCSAPRSRQERQRHHRQERRRRLHRQRPRTSCRFPDAVADEVRAVDGVDAVTSFRSGQATDRRQRACSLQGVTADTVDRTLRLDDGHAATSPRSPTGHDPGRRGRRQGQGLEGRRPACRSPSARPAGRTLTLGGTYDREPDRRRLPDRPRDLRAELLAAAATRWSAMTVTPDADAGRGARRADPGAAGVLRTWRSATRASSRRSSASRSTSCSASSSCCSALAVLIAALGIVNTLALSVIERTREIGLLRAVGMGRRRCERMIRLESVVIAIFGDAARPGRSASLFGVGADARRSTARGSTELVHPVRAAGALPAVARRSPGWWQPSGRPGGPHGSTCSRRSRRSSSGWTRGAGPGWRGGWR